MKKNVKISVVILVCLALIMSACTEEPAFVDLPAPVGGKYPTSLITSTIGDTMISQLQSPLISVGYGETHDGPGAVAQETITVLDSDISGVMVETTWGSLGKGEVKLTEAYDPQGYLIEGRISMKLDGDSIFQWMKGCFSNCILNRSRVIIGFIAPTPGEIPVLSYVLYTESWGTTSRNILAMGTAARWNDAQEIFPEYAQWGFWETYDSTDLVIEALRAADDRLLTVSPSIKVVDTDSVSEIIGRQTGLQVYVDGTYSGTISVVYRNNFGHMPNTEFIGKGSLSLLTFNFNGICEEISVISPEVPTSFSSLFVFGSCGVADRIKGKTALSLYQPIRDNMIEGVRFAIYANGYVGEVTQATSEEPITVGEGGGVFYSVIGEPTLEELIYARNLLSMMGRGGVDAIGFGYATETMSGNGIEYYLGTLILALTPVDQQFTVFGSDSGLLDRSGYMILP